MKGLAVGAIGLMALAGCVSVNDSPSPHAEPTLPSVTTAPGWADDFGNNMEDVKPVTTTTRPRPTTTTTSVRYANCDAVRSAGKAPIRRGDPGYSAKLDRDGDGVGCE